METKRLRTTLAETGMQVAAAARELDEAMRAVAIIAGARADDVSATLDGVFGRLSAAAAGLRELDRQLDDDSELQDTRACPKCGRSVIAAVKVCGHCWTPLIPTRQ